MEKKEKRERDEKRLKERMLALKSAAPARRPFGFGNYRGRGQSGYHPSGGRRQEDRQQDRNASYQAQSSGDRIKCYNCHGFGHLARDCYNKPAAAGAPPK